MRAVVCRNWCNADGLSIEDLPPSPPAAGEVRIRVHVAGVNFADTLIIAGNYQIKPPLPSTPGFEAAGTVIACGDGVSRFRPGERVVALVEYGAFAEEVVAPEAQVLPLPPQVEDRAAAAFPVAYGTSHFGLTYKGRLRAGETLLVLGAAGGVGLTAVEIGKLLGAKVIAAASGEEKMQIALAAGADHAADARSLDFRDQVKALTGGRGVDVVYDPVGGAAFEAALRSTKAGGRILIIGFASGEVPQIPANILLVKNLTVSGLYYGAHKTLAPQAMAASLAELLGWLAEGRLKPHVSRAYPLDQVSVALNELRARRTTGKVVLTMGS